MNLFLQEYSFAIACAVSHKREPRTMSSFASPLVKLTLSSLFCLLSAQCPTRFVRFADVNGHSGVFLAGLVPVWWVTDDRARVVIRKRAFRGVQP